ncbi:MAG: leucyl aminopeptidase [Actinomycetota bacterium]|jgi:leucyl aminopeptidase|nr:leucyl aminopeptidase [Actinomycetota bacterium]
MPIALALADAIPDDVQVIGIPVYAGRTSPDGAGPSLDVAYLAERGFEGKVGETMTLPGTAGGATVVAVGVGDPAKITAETLRRSAASLVKAVWRDARVATTLLAAAPATMPPALAAQAVAEGALLASYRFTTYQSDPKGCRIETLAVVGEGTEADQGIQRGVRVARAVALARDVVNEPAGAMTPRRLAEIATQVAEDEGLQIEVLDEIAIVNEGLGGLAGVAQGSDEPARLIRLTYDPPGATATLALVGKGITFDSGGLSIKTAEGMETMKTDKSGAAAVLGAMSAIPALALLDDLAVKVIAIIPTTENMPGGAAIKPGDVLKIRNGKTVEVLNTDAEGRLVLADGLSLAVEAGVDAILDLATLTGACVVALGRRIAGLMGNDEGWMAQVREASERAGESVWPLPLPEEYRKLIDSDVADVKNIGGRYAGALTAGLFLKEFVGDVPWAHLDIAGPARSDDDEGYLSKGGTGFGVRTILEAVAAFRAP